MRNQILTLEERVQLSVTQGESHFREFKSALEGAPENKIPRDIKDICTDIGRTLVAFANADGGVLLIGVEDDGKITGLQHTDEQVRIMSNANKTHVHSETPLQNCKSRIIDIAGKTILYFQVDAGTKHCHLTSDGRCLQRKDLETVPVPSEHIKATRDEIRSKEYDRSYVNNALTADLDKDILAAVAEHISKGMSIEKCLQHLELAEFNDGKLVLKKAALLLFAKDINKWHPRVQVRVLKVDGTELQTGENFKVSYDSEVRENVVKLIEKSWELLRPHLTETRFSKDGLFKTQIIYPELACREALINAIAHRDYSNEGAGIEIIVFSDRIEVKNPGGLLSSISVEDIKSLSGAHQSRNAHTARVLRELGYMRELGEGIRRIYELMNLSDLADPDIVSTPTNFRITLYQKHIYSTEEKLWLENFAQYNFSRNQKTVIRLGCNGRPFSPQEVWEACGIVDTEEYRKLVESLYVLDILENKYNKNQVNALAEKQRTTRKKIKKFQIKLPKQCNAVQPELQTKESQKAPERQDVTVYVGNLPYSATIQQITESLNRFGSIKSIHYPVDHATGRSKGYAFVAFADSIQAQNAINESTNVILSGRNIFINWAIPKALLRTVD